MIDIDAIEAELADRCLLTVNRACEHVRNLLDRVVELEGEIEDVRDQHGQEIEDCQRYAHEQVCEANQQAERARSEVDRMERDVRRDY